MRILRLLALTTAALAVAFGLLYHFLPAGAPPDAEPYLGAVLPASSYELADGPGYRYYKAAGPGGVEGVLFVTSELAPGVKGYSGPVPVLVGLLPSGRLTGVKILRNNETPSYSQRVDRPQFTARFAGKAITDPFLLDGDVDGVTRATVTARAVAEGVKQASRRAGHDVFGLASPSDDRAVTQAFRDPALYGLIALFAIALFYHLRGRAGGDYKRPRWAVLAVSFVFLGVILASPVALVNILGLMALRMPGLDSLKWYILVAGAVASALLWGRLYCGWLCPFGALQEFLSWLPVRKLKVSPILDRKARSLKYAVLWLVTVAAFTTGLLEIANFEPYGTLFPLQGGLLAWGLVGVTLGAGVVVPRFWCRYFCPVGATLGLLSGLGIFRRARFEANDGKDRGVREHGLKSGLAFKIILTVSALLVVAVLAANTVEAVRMRDPDYARMVEDRKRYEEVISKKGLSLHPAAYWKGIGVPGAGEPKGK